MARSLRYLIRFTLLSLGLTCLGFSSAQSAPVPFVQLHAEVADAVEDQDYTFGAPYPNPFNPSTVFTLSVEADQRVEIEVYNVLGQRVATIYEGLLAAGQIHSFTFEAGDDLPTGIYLARVEGETFTATRRMTLLR